MYCKCVFVCVWLGSILFCFAFAPIKILTVFTAKGDEIPLQRIYAADVDGWGDIWLELQNRWPIICLNMTDTFFSLSFAYFLLIGKSATLSMGGQNGKTNINVMETIKKI